MEKDISCKWKTKENQNGNPYFKKKKVDFKIKNDQGINQEEDITIANINTANIGTPHYISKH